MIEVVEDRFIDENLAWDKINQTQENIFNDLGRLKCFCGISRSENHHKDGGFYRVTNHRDRPIMTALVYRDSANYTISQIVINNDNIESLKDYVKESEGGES